MQTPQAIIDFWFSRDAERYWFHANVDFDATIARRFGDLLHAARNDRLNHWEETPLGALALVIVLDQFPRNIYRGKAKCYDLDPLARRAARDAIEHHFDNALSPAQKTFLYLPFMHSENLDDQNYSVELCHNAGLSNLEFAEDHREIIKRFGRFPHRNALLKRINTQEEDNYLASGHAFTGGQVAHESDD